MVQVGDRVSVDPVKVGQPRREGVVAEVTEGISGPRLWIEWDDGTRTSLAAGSGNMVIGGGRKAKPSKPKPKAKKPKAKKPKPKKAKGKKAKGKKAKGKGKKAKRKPKP